MTTNSMGAVNSANAIKGQTAPRGPRNTSHKLIERPGLRLDENELLKPFERWRKKAEKAGSRFAHPRAPRARGGHAWYPQQGPNCHHLAVLPSTALARQERGLSSPWCPTCGAGELILRIGVGRRSGRVSELDFRSRRTGPTQSCETLIDKPSLHQRPPACSPTSFEHEDCTPRRKIRCHFALS